MNNYRKPVNLPDDISYETEMSVAPAEPITVALDDTPDTDPPKSPLEKLSYRLESMQAELTKWKELYRKLEAEKKISLDSTAEWRQKYESTERELDFSRNTAMRLRDENQDKNKQIEDLLGFQDKYLRECNQASALKDEVERQKRECVQREQSEAALSFHI